MFDFINLIEIFWIFRSHISKKRERNKIYILIKRERERNKKREIKWERKPKKLGKMEFKVTNDYSRSYQPAERFPFGFESSFAKCNGTRRGR